MPVLDNIAALPTGASGPFSSDVTDPLIAVTSMARVVPDRYPNVSAEERHAALRADIDSAVAAGDNDAAAAHFAEYRSACGGFEPALLLTEANVLSAVGNSPAALESVTEYLRVADNTNEDYFAAMSMARELERSLVSGSPSLRPSADYRRSRSCPTRTPQRWSSWSKHRDSFKPTSSKATKRWSAWKVPGRNLRG
jgi:hypothetical protein